MLKDDVDLPTRQARLRDACCVGDIRTVERLLSTQACGWRGLAFRVFSGKATQEPASVDFVYVTDRGRTVLHYIASGLDHAHPRLDELYASEDVTCTAHHGAQRAELLLWLIQGGHLGDATDWNVADAGGKTAVYWATLTRSFDVLSVLCNSAKDHGCSLDVSIPDFTNSSPLDVAVASQQWDMVQLLVQNGGLKDNVRLQTAVENLAQVAPDVAAKRDGGHRGWEGISSMLSGLLGYSKPLPPSHSQNPSLSSMVSCEEDVEEEEEDPTGTSQTPLIFCSMHEVEAFWDEQTRYVSDVCSIDDGSARQLLKEHGHDADAAIQDFLVNHAKHSLDFKGQEAMVTMQTCSVCFLSFSPLSKNVKLSCGHNVACSNCWRQFITAKLEEGLSSHLKCMEPQCKAPVPLSEARNVLTDQSGPWCSFERLQQQVLRSYVDSNPNIKWCPRPGCEFSISLADQLCKKNICAASVEAGSPTVTCACGHTFCWHCLEEAHEPASCEQVKQWRQLIDSEQLIQNRESEDWLDSHTQPCPRCNAKVQRSGGCNHMVCTVCGQHYCYACGGDWSLHGPRSGGFYACTLRDPAAQRSSLRSLVHSVSTTLRSTLRSLYRRERDYLQRYFAQTEDATDLATVVRHMRRLVSTALAGDGTGDNKGSASVKLHSVQRQLALGDSVQPETRLSLSAELEQAGVKIELSNTGDLRRRRVWQGELPRCPVHVESSADLGTLMNVDAHGNVDEGPVVPDLKHVHGEARRLHPRANMRNILKEWEQAVNKGRNVLRNTYIATYFMDRSTQRLQLESLQKRLEGELGQLTEMLRQLPHRRSMLEGPKTEDTQPASPHESFIALVRITFSMIRELGHCLICAVMRVLNSQSTMIEEVSLHGRQIRDQFYYVVALNQQRSRIVKLLKRVNYTCHNIVRTGRLKHSV